MNPGSEIYLCKAMLIETMLLDLRIKDPDQRERFEGYISPTQRISNTCVQMHPHELIFEIPASAFISVIDKQKDFMLSVKGQVIGTEGDQLIEWSINEQNLNKLVMSNVLADINLSKISGRFTTSIKSIRPRIPTSVCSANESQYASVALLHRPTQILSGYDQDDTPFEFDPGNFIQVDLIIDEPLSSPQNVSLLCNVSGLTGQAMRLINITPRIIEITDEYGVNGIYPGGVAKFTVVLDHHETSLLDPSNIDYSWTVICRSYGHEIRPKNASNSAVFEVQLGDAPSSPQPGAMYVPPTDVQINAYINVDGVMGSTGINFKPDNFQMAERKRILTLLYRKLQECKCPPMIIAKAVRWIFGIK